MNLKKPLFRLPVIAGRMHSWKSKPGTFAAIALCVLGAVYLVIARPGYLTSVEFLGGLRQAFNGQVDREKYLLLLRRVARSKYSR